MRCGGAGKIDKLAEANTPATWIVPCPGCPDCSPSPSTEACPTCESDDPRHLTGPCRILNAATDAEPDHFHQPPSTDTIKGERERALAAAIDRIGKAPIIDRTLRPDDEATCRLIDLWEAYRLDPEAGECLPEPASPSPEPSPEVDSVLFRQCEDSGHPPVGDRCHCGYRRFPAPPQSEEPPPCTCAHTGHAKTCPANPLRAALDTANALAETWRKSSALWTERYYGEAIPRIRTAEAKAQSYEEALREKAASFDTSAVRFEQDAHDETQARKVRYLIQADCYRQAATELRQLISALQPPQETRKGKD